MNPADAILFVDAAIGVFDLVERLAALGRRMQAGENVTPEQLEALKAETDAKVAAFDAAAQYDRGGD